MFALSPTAGLLLATSITAVITFAVSLIALRGVRESNKAVSETGRLTADQRATQTAVEAQGSLIDDLSAEIGRLREQRGGDRETIDRLEGKLADTHDEMTEAVGALRAEIAEAHAHYEECEAERKKLTLRLVDLENGS